MAKAETHYTIGDLEHRYNDITTLYDFAEELVATVESDLIADPEKQLAIIEPLISDIGEATDLLSEEFILIAESKKRKSKNRANKAQIESSLRKLYSAIAEYNAHVKDISKKAHGAIMNIADPIVQKIQRQLEKVVVIFLEFMHISLNNVMGHAELAALKARDARVALMMHQYALQQQQ